MTYEDFQAIEDELLDSFRCGEISETTFEKEMEALQSAWEEGGEE